MFTATQERQYGFQLYEEFFTLNSTLWPSTDDGGTNTDGIADAAGGILQLLPTAAQNKYRARATANKLFTVAQHKPIKYEIKLNLTEANVNQAGIFAGLSNIVTTGFLAASTYVPPTSFSGFVAYKQPGTSIWKFVASNGTAQQFNANLGAFTSGTDQYIEIQVDSPDGVNAICLPILNGVPPISQGQASFTVPLASLAGLRPCFGVVTGSTSAETLLVDYVVAEQAR